MGMQLFRRRRIMKRKRLMAILLAGCMVFGYNPVLLQAEEWDDQLYVEDDAVFTIDEEEEGIVTQEELVSVEGDGQTAGEDIDEIIEESDGLYDENLIFYAGSDGEDEEVDVTPPKIDTDSVSVDYPEGKTEATAGDTVVISVKISDETAVKEANIIFVTPVTGRTIGQYPLKYNDITGCWEYQFNVNDQTESGTWTIDRLAATDPNGNWVYMWARDTDLTKGNFVVTGTDPDVTPPVIDPDSIEVTYPEGKTEATTGDTVIISVKISDDTAVKEANIMFVTPVTGRTVGQYQLKYNDTSGCWEYAFPVTAQTEQGTWKISRLAATDPNGNWVYMWARDTDLTKGNFIVYDREKPRIDESSLTITVPDGLYGLFAGGEARIGVRVTDNVAVDKVQMELSSPDLSRVATADLTYNGESQLYEYIFSATEETAIGVWEISRITASDANGNTRIVTGDSLTGNTFEVHEVPPEITLTIGVYDCTNAVCGRGGTYTFNAEDRTHTADKHTVYSGSRVELVASPDEDYKFVGWFEGKIAEGTDELGVEPVSDLDDLIGDPESACSFYADRDIVLCAVFSEVATGSCGENVTYELDKNTGVLTISGTGPMADFSESGIPNPFRKYQDSIKTIIVEDGVTYISENAFSDCAKVSEVMLPDSVTEIGSAAFRNCIELAKITLPKNITKIEFETFAYCFALQDVTIPESVSVICENAFMECVKLPELRISANATSIGQYAFGGCCGLTSVTVARDNPVYDSRDNCNAIIETATDTLIKGCSATVIPDTVKTIGSGAFEEPYEYMEYYYDVYNEEPDTLKLTKIDIPANVKEIGEFAFTDCIGLESVMLHDGLQTIDDFAFQDCYKLNSIIIPDTVTKLGEAAFYSCIALRSVSLPSGILQINNSTFSQCRALETINFPDGLESFGSHVFDGCRVLTEVSLPASLKELKYTAFEGSGVVSKSGVIHYAGSRLQWKKITGGDDRLLPQDYGACDILFNSNGGSGVDPQIVTIGNTVTRPDDPVKPSPVQWGAKFAGWYEDEGLTRPYDFDSPVSKDLTLYANWYYGLSISNYDITNHTAETGGKYEVLYDGQGNGELQWGCMNMTVEHGDRLTFRAHPDPGYAFIGWYKGVYTGGNTGQSAEPLDVTDPNNLLSKETAYELICDEYAVICPVFEQLPRYGVTFDVNGGSGEMEAVSAYTGYPAPACTFTAPEDMHFAGWNTAADGSGTLYKAGDSLDPTKDMILYAQWGAHEFETAVRKATPDEDGLVFEVCPACGEEHPVAPIPKASGYKLSAASYTYDGKAKTPAVTVTNSAGDVLDASNYTVSYADNINAGTATATVAFKGDYYSGTKSLAFTIGKAANPMSVKAKTVKLKASKVMKKKQTVKAAKAYTVKAAQGNVTYKLVSVKKAKFKKYFKINTKTGKVTVKKKLKKGTYKVKVRVTAAGNANYEGAEKVVTVKIKVK